MKNSATYTCKLIIFFLTGFILTLGIHHFIPQQQVPFSNSYLLHIFFDTILISLILFIIWEGNLRINTQLNKKFNWEQKPISRLIFQIILNTIYSGFIIIALTLLYGFLLSIFISDYNSREQVSKSFPIFQNVFYLFLVTFLFYQVVYICIYFFQQWSHSLVEAERLKRDNLNAQLRALQNQVNPHFLFNNLNSLISLIMEDRNCAVEFVQELANVYRYLLQQQEEHIVRIVDELRFINSYIFLQKTRSGNNLITEIKVDKKYHDYFIAPHTIQILVENAIKHNIISSERPLTIRIYNADECLIIENNLQKKLSAQPRTGIGLQNIINRYKILGYKSILVNEANNHFRVTVPMIKPGEVNESINHRR